MARLDGKVALITGSGRHKGLGEAIARRLAADGARIVITDIGQAKEHMGAEHIGTTDEMEQIVAEIGQAGGQAIAVPLDVRDEAQVEAAVAKAVESFGRLDILVNNAGIGYLIRPITEMPKEEWEAVLDVNLMGAFLCTKHAARRMIEQGEGGRIINIASQAAKSGHPHMSAYVSSKHGMVGLTRTAAVELGPHGITVNAICPNHVTTGLGAKQNDYFAAYHGLTVEQYLERMENSIPMRRKGYPEDTANACAFLCSDEGAYVTGEAMNVSGGAEMH